jgi:DNA-binding NarL/FixJ family response regulator
MGKNGERTAIVVDEQPLWLDAMEHLLNRAGMRVVAKTTDASEALDLVVAHEPDILLADYGVRSGELDVVECLRRAHEVHPELKSVVLSASNEPRQIEAAFAAGASAFCVKTAAQGDLMAAIRQTFELSIYLARPAPVAPAEPVEPALPPDAPRLTRRELEILRLAADGHSNAQLARMLWVTEQTVKFHLSNIYRKLDVSNRTEASRWAQRHGLLESSAAQTAA